jgi:hypothetical protein
MTASAMYAFGFTLLGLWGVFSARRAWKHPGAKSRRRWMLTGTGLLFAGSCFFIADAVWFAWFQPWLLWPLGASFLLMIPQPCYFDAVDRIRGMHLARNVLFAAVAVLCFAVALRWLPAERLGL